MIKHVYVFDYTNTLVFEGSITKAAKYLMVTQSAVSNAIKSNKHMKGGYIMHHYVTYDKNDANGRKYDDIISAWYVIDNMGFRSFKDMIEYTQMSEDEIRELFNGPNSEFYIYKPTFKGKFLPYIKNKNKYGIKEPEKIYIPLKYRTSEPVKITGITNINNDKSFDIFKAIDRLKVINIILWVFIIIFIAYLIFN